MRRVLQNVLLPIWNVTATGSAMIAIATFVAIAPASVVEASEASLKAELEYRIEDTIKKLIGPLIDPQQILVIVKVSELPPNQAGATPPQGGQLPYSTVKVEPGVLQRLLSKNTEDDLIQAAYEVELAFDKTVAKETINLISKKIRLKLNVDDQKRTLKTSTATLFTPKADSSTEAIRARLDRAEEDKKRLADEFAEKQRKLADEHEKEKKALEKEKEKEKLEAIEKEKEAAAKREEELKAKEIPGQTGLTPASAVPQDPSESVRIENERTRLELERVRFEAAKAEAEANEKLRQERIALESKINEQKELMVKTVEAQEKKVKEAETEKQALVASTQKSLVDQLKDFQLSILALMGVVGMILLGVVVGGSHKKGLGALSASLQGLGEALKTAFGSSTADAGSEAIGDSGKDDGSGATIAAGGPQDLIQDERYKQFLTLVEEKVEVLTGENNFGFYRHFLDMVTRQVHLAAALLVSVKPETARLLVAAISVDDLARIREYLGRDGALGEAQGNRGKAMEAFYARISMDEFTNSPLLNIKGAAWITKLSTTQLRDLASRLSPQDQITFLALFTPSRLVQILESATDDNQKAHLIEAFKQLDAANAADVEETLKKAQDLYQGQQQEKLDQVKKIIDNPKFYADIVVDLNPDNRERFLKAISQRTELLDVIKNYYIPFDDVERLAPRILKDIFGRRPANQTALILLTAKESMHAMVIEAAPEALRDTIREELEALKSDEDNKRKNTQKSQEYQQDICRYLLQLNREGLLEYRSNDGTSPRLAVAS